MDRDAPFVEKISATIQMKNDTFNLLSEEIIRDIYADPTGETKGK